MGCQMGRGSTSVVTFTKLVTQWCERDPVLVDCSLMEKHELLVKEQQVLVKF
jgi:hypothetical protein